MNPFEILYNKYIYRTLLKRRLAGVGSNFRLGHSSTILKPEFFNIGENFFSGPGTYFSTNQDNLVTIGDHVMFGPSCKILGGNHDHRFTGNHMYFNQATDHMKSSINIEDGVWVGANSVVLSGADISEGVVVGAMSLINSYIPPYCTVVGIPGKKVKPRFDNWTDLETLLSNVNSKYSLAGIQKIYQEHSLSI